MKSSSKICLSKNSLKNSTGGCPVMSGTTPGVAESTGGCSCSSARADSVDVCGCAVMREGLLLACSLVCMGEREGLPATCMGEWLSFGSGDSAAEP